MFCLASSPNPVWKVPSSPSLRSSPCTISCCRIIFSRVSGRERHVESTASLTLFFFKKKLSLKEKRIWTKTIEKNSLRNNWLCSNPASIFSSTTARKERNPFRPLSPMGSRDRGILAKKRRGRKCPLYTVFSSKKGP